MRILVTNDDGIDSRGLRALVDALREAHEVWVIAPEGERSGVSHCVTLKGPIRFTRHAEREFAVSGSPADCVILSMFDAIPVRPDAVVSGINHGPNIGTDLLYSGTAAAARQGALMRLPSLAVSLDFSNDGMEFARPAAFVAANLERFVALWSADHFININFPASGEYRGVRVSSPCQKVYNDRLRGFEAPDGRIYYFMQGEGFDIAEEEGSDWQAIKGGFVSVSPIRVHPNMGDDGAYRAAKFEVL